MQTLVVVGGTLCGGGFLEFLVLLACIRFEICSPETVQSLSQKGIGAFSIGLVMIVAAIALALHWSKLKRLEKQGEGKSASEDDQEVCDVLPTHDFFLAHRILDRLCQWFPARGLSMSCRFLIVVIAITSVSILFLRVHYPPAESAVGQLPILGSILDPAREPNLIQRHVLWVRCLFATLLLLSLIGEFLLRNRSASDARTRRRVQRVLDKFHGDLAPIDPDCTHRLTLFRTRKSLLFGKWNGICARGGKTHRNFSTIFGIDTESESKCTGAVGSAWWHAAKHRSIPMFTFIELDNLDINSHSYAAECGIALVESKILTHRSTKFLAGAVIVDGEIWGVLVFDTDAPNWAQNDSAQRKLRKDFEMAIFSISWALQK